MAEQLFKKKNISSKANNKSIYFEKKGKNNCYMFSSDNNIMAMIFKKTLSFKYTLKLQIFRIVFQICQASGCVDSTLKGNKKQSGQLGKYCYNSGENNKGLTPGIGRHHLLNTLNMAAFQVLCQTSHHRKPHTQFLTQEFTVQWQEDLREGYGFQRKLRARINRVW